MRTIFSVAILLLTAPAYSAEVPIDLLAIIEKTRTEPTVAPPIKTTAPIEISVVKAKPATILPKPAKRSGYPVRSGWWTGCPNWQHLTRGEHAGKFDHAWLASLSWAELQSLHSDDHEGRVKSAYVVRPARKPAASYGSNCPNGQCPRVSTPTYRPRGIFRRR